MILRTQEFFHLLQVHHMVPPAKREADLRGRLATIAEGQCMADPLTRRCLGLFLERRLPAPAQDRSTA